MSVTRIPNETERLLLALAKVFEVKNPDLSKRLKAIARGSARLQGHQDSGCERSRSDSLPPRP